MDAWKRFLMRAGQALADGMLMADPIAYSHYLVYKANAVHPVPLVPSHGPSDGHGGDALRRTPGGGGRLLDGAAFRDSTDATWPGTGQPRSA
jgi:hypothetical protein